MYNPVIMELAFFWLLITIISALYLLAWKAFIQDKDLSVSESYFLLIMVFCSLLLLVGAFSVTTPVINICDHYEVVNGKRICIPTKNFSLPASFLKHAILQSPSAKLYDESGKEVGPVHIHISRSGDRPTIYVTMPDNVTQKVVKLVEHDKHVFYLNIYTNGTLYKVMKFMIFNLL